MFSGIFPALIGAFIKFIVRPINKEIDVLLKLNKQNSIIFLDIAEKSHSWKKGYLNLIRKRGENIRSKPNFYIGPLLEDDIKMHKIIIPEGRTNWGWICLCQMIRTLENDEWGEVRVLKNIETYNEEQQTKWQDYVIKSIKANKTKTDLTELLKINSEEKFQNTIWALEKKDWSFCLIESKLQLIEGKLPRFEIVPIGKSCYIFYGKDIAKEVKEDVDCAIKNAEKVFQDVLAICYITVDINHSTKTIIDLINIAKSWEEIDRYSKCMWDKIMSYLGDVIYWGEEKEKFQEYVQKINPFKENETVHIEKVQYREVNLLNKRRS